MISGRIGDAIRVYLLSVGRVLARTGLTPNQLTLIGLALNLVVAIVIALGAYRVGGVLLLLASGFDMLDGAVARSTNAMTKFGGFLDSTLDRYSEIVVYVGVLIYLQRTDNHAQLGALLILAAASGALLISYARARAEAAGFTAEVGIAARSERVVLLAIALIFGWALWGLWILAIATHITAVTRIVHVWRQAQRAPRSVSRR